MSEASRELLKKGFLNRAYAFAGQNGLQAEAAAIRACKIAKWNKPYTTGVRKGMIVDLFAERGLLDAFARFAYPDPVASRAEAKFRRASKIRRQYDEYLAHQCGEEPVASSLSAGESREESLTFAIEAHLRDFLAKNLGRLEEGLRLYEADGRNGIEFSVEAGRIDILAVDRNDALVVIELKLSQGRNKTLGQLLYYMGWVDEHLRRGKSRGMIVASEITPDLQTAVSRVPGITLAQYKMAFTIELVKQVQ
jgi:RecB family endonuclease NucS